MSDVPCASCRVCCRHQLVILTPEDEPRITAYDFREIVGAGIAIKVLNARADGECVHLGPDGCLIYDQRPEVCRAYDCRKQFKIMSRNERRQFRNSQIWDEARKRLGSLDAQDLAELDDYKRRASASFPRSSGRADNRPDNRLTTTPNNGGFPAPPFTGIEK